jgi:hypothetical protein
MKLSILKLVLIAFLLTEAFLSSAQASEIKLASWNIRNISDTSRSDAELGIISLILSRYDFVAIQEVRKNDKALKRIQKILKDDFKVDYSIDVSPPVGDQGKDTLLYGELTR